MKAKEIEQYQRTFVYFYCHLTGRARTIGRHVFFDPTLEVEILGLEEGKDRALAGLRVILPEKSTLIGSWISQEESYLITIYKRDSKYYMMRSRPDRKRKYPESDSSTFDLFKLPSTDEPKFSSPRTPKAVQSFKFPSQVCCLNTWIML